MQHENILMKTAIKWSAYNNNNNTDLWHKTCKPVWTIIANALMKGGAEHWYFFTTRQSNRDQQEQKQKKF